MLSEEYKIQLFTKMEKIIYTVGAKSIVATADNWSILKVLSHLSYSTKRR
jgi:hypothetical protein